MNFPTHDTSWAISSKGNHWKRKDGIALVAGKRKDGDIGLGEATAFFRARLPVLKKLKVHSKTTRPTKTTVGMTTTVTNQKNTKRNPFKKELP
jgi:hypothetical protein